jgi:predicted nucleotidyltransferase
MRLQRPFETITTAVDGDVLLVLARAERGFTTGDVARLVANRSIDGIRNALNRLVEQGVVFADRAGRTLSYRLNREHLAAEAIIALSRQRDLLLDRLGRQVADWAISPVFAAVFGSAVTGDMRPNSDLDLFFVRPDDSDDDAWQDQVATLAELATRWTGNDARPLSMTVGGVERAVRQFDPHERSVLRDIASDGIAFAGPPTWLQERVRP